MLSCLWDLAKSVRKAQRRESLQPFEPTSESLPARALPYLIGRRAAGVNAKSF